MATVRPSELRLFWGGEGGRQLGKGDRPRTPTMRSANFPLFPHVQFPLGILIDLVGSCVCVLLPFQTIAQIDSGRPRVCAERCRYPGDPWYWGGEFWVGVQWYIDQCLFRRVCISYNKTPRAGHVLSSRRQCNGIRAYGRGIHFSV